MSFLTLGTDRRCLMLEIPQIGHSMYKTPLGTSVPLSPDPQDTRKDTIWGDYADYQSASQSLKAGACNTMQRAKIVDLSESKNPTLCCLCVICVFLGNKRARADVMCWQWKWYRVTWDDARCLLMSLCGVFYVFS